MRRPNADHLDLSWRVHELAREFDLLDVWRFPIVADDAVPLATFTDFLAAQQEAMLTGRSPAALLFRLRGAMGQAFGWDDGHATTNRPPPPDSLRHQLATEGEVSIAIAGEGHPFEPVFATDDEQLAEIQNATVHALMHLARVPVEGGWSPQMAVYVKRRGALGRFYMALISPFRHAIVYPAMMRSAKRDWPGWLIRQPPAEGGRTP